jgi:Family of unknown function (DUF6527)
VSVSSDVPEIVLDGKLYLVGGKGSYWQAVLKCPCGCSAPIQLAMSQGARPCWKVSGSMERPTRHPSVNRTSGCRSHFILRNGIFE